MPSRAFDRKNRIELDAPINDTRAVNGSRSPLEFSGSGDDPRWSRALSALNATEQSVLRGPVAREVDGDVLRRRVAEFDMEDGIGESATTRVLGLLEEATTHTIHPRYFGLFNPTPAAWGQVADLIAARMNPQLAVWSHAPAAVEMEQRALQFVANRLGVPARGSFFTSGGEEANRAGVQVALARTYPQVVESGVRALDRQPVFYVSTESHLAWLKIAASLGLGHDAVRLVPVDTDFAMDVGALRAMILADRNAGLGSFMIGATAGTTSAGAIDPLASLADVATSEGLALHVDAAWAGAAAMSDRWRQVLVGIENADTVTVDAHKWLSQPMGTGMFFTRVDEWLRAAYRVSTSYMPTAVEGSVDYYQHSPQWSRPFRGLRLFLTLAAAGRRAFETQIDHDVALGTHLRRSLEAEGWTIVNRQTRLPVVCFSRPGHEANAAWHEAIAARVVQSGVAWISTVRLAGWPALRACITSCRTTDDDVAMLVGALSAAIRTEPNGWSATTNE
jgi:aromatic-L-amino-acid/L-tryptophan decarboxylase